MSNTKVLLHSGALSLRGDSTNAEFISTYLKYFYEGSSSLNYAVKYGYKNIAKLLLEHKADVNTKDDYISKL